MFISRLLQLKELCGSCEQIDLFRVNIYWPKSSVMCFQRCHAAGTDTQPVQTGDVCCLRWEGRAQVGVCRAGHQAAEVGSARLELRGDELSCRDL